MFRSLAVQRGKRLRKFPKTLIYKANVKGTADAATFQLTGFNF